MVRTSREFEKELRGLVQEGRRARTGKGRRAATQNIKIAERARNAEIREEKKRLKREAPASKRRRAVREKVGRRLVGGIDRALRGIPRGVGRPRKLSNAQIRAILAERRERRGR